MPDLPAEPPPSPVPGVSPGRPAAFHRRATLLAAAFGHPIRRATWIGSLVGLLAGLVAGMLVRSAVSPILVVAVVAAVSTGVGILVAVVAMPRRTMLALEAFAWEGRVEQRRFAARVHGRVPTGAGAAQAWVATHASEPATRLPRVELLGSLGDVDRARAELASLPEPAAGDDLARVERAAVAVWLEFLATGEADLGPLDEVAATLPRGSRIELEAATRRAIAESRLRLDRGDPDPLGPLVAVRARLPRDATRTLIEDTWRRMGLSQAVIGGVLGVLVVAQGG